MVTTAPVTIEQAAAILGVSASTIRRRIRAGALQVEETRRPQGVVWLVHVPPGTAPAAETATVDTTPVTTTATAPTAQAEALASLIHATLTPIIAPLVAEQAALRQTVERQADQLVGQAERLGRQGAELERATSTVVALGDELAATEASRRRDARLLIAGAVLLVVLAVLAMIGMVLPAWAR